MLLGPAQSIATLLTIVLFYLLDSVFIRRFDRQRRASGSGRAWDFTFFIFAMTALLVLQPLLFPVLSIRTGQAWGLWLQLTGLFLVLASLALHIWSRLHLGQYYAERVEVQPDHRVIRSGPYARVRHPVISSFFGISAGLFLINPGLATLVTLVYTLWDFLRAARQEEQLLSRTLPGYEDYARHTPRFLPRLWRGD